jgi:ribonuclease E
VADFDGYSSEPASLPVVQAESFAPPAPPPEQPHADYAPQQVAAAPAEAETAQEAERAAARRRSTVREKVSFLANAQPEAAPPMQRSLPEPSAPAAAEPDAGTATDDTQPRKAGWWSRRFGNGE